VEALGSDNDERMGGDRPVLLCCPYLPLREPVEFAGWWLGPLSAYEARG
jgi:hypothetical protein